MKKILLSLVAMGAAYSADFDAPLDTKVHHKYTYMSYGTGFPTLLHVNVARRVQNHEFGYEFGGGVMPAYVLNAVHAFGNFLHYPHPDLEAQMYYGVGVQSGYVVAMAWDSNKVYGTGLSGYGLFAYPQMVIGKSFASGKNKQHFYQFTASPGGYMGKTMAFLPIVGFALGYGF